MLQPLARIEPIVPDAGMGDAGNLYRAFVETAEVYGARTAVEWQGQRISFDELLTLTHRLATRIVRCDDAPTVLGVLADNSPCQIATYLAASFAGHTFAPLSPEYPLHMLQELVDRFAITVLAHDVINAATADGLRVRHKVDAQRAMEEEGPGDLAGRACADPPDHTCLMFTSGSTGRPKGVGIPYRAIRNLVRSPDYVAIGPDDRMAYVANPAFDASIFEIWGGLLNGATLVHLPRRQLPDPDAVADFLRSERISIIFLTTALFNLVAKRRPSAFQPVDYVLFGGERASVDAVREAYARGKPRHLVHVYGPTECTTFSTFHDITALPAADQDLPIGQPIKGAGAVILAADGTPLEGQAAGELHIFGAGLANGYAGDPALTQQRFVWLAHEGRQARTYRTGDLVRRDEAGDLVFVERLDDQIKRRGFRFSLREIDEDLLSIPGVRQAKTVKVDAPGVTCRVCSFVALDDPSEQGQQRVRAGLAELAPAFRLPNQIITLAAFPLNANGKIDVTQLRRMASAPAAEPPVPEPAAARGSATAGHIRKVFAAHCLEPNCSPDRNFFEAGGDSLGAAECLLELEELLGTPISYSDFLTQPTIAGLERLLERRQSRPRWRHELRQAGPADAARCLVFFGEHGDVLQGALSAGVRVVWRNPTDIGDPDVHGFASAHELAEAYAGHLLTLIDQAPVVAVVGFSYGAVVALELASLLEREGRSVGRLILIDPDADACCGMFRRSRSRALGAEEFQRLITRWKILNLLRDLRRRHWRTVRAKAVTLATSIAARIGDQIWTSGNVRLRRRELVQRCFAHYERHVAPSIEGPITLLLTLRALEDELSLQRDTALLRRTFGVEVDARVVPGCSSHDHFARPDGVTASATVIADILGPARWSARQPAT